MGLHTLVVCQRGLSLVEAMAAVVVVLAGMTAVLHFFPDSMATGRHSLERTQATLLGKGKLEELRLEGFEAIADPRRLATAPAPFWDSDQRVAFPRFRWQAEVNRVAEDLLDVRLRVMWPWPDQKFHLSFATYVSKR